VIPLGDGLELNCECEHRVEKYDCDGDKDFYCHNNHNDCMYKKHVIDVDGDCVTLCRKGMW